MQLIRIRFHLLDPQQGHVHYISLEWLWKCEQMGWKFWRWYNLRNMTISEEIGYKKRNSADWHIVSVWQNQMGNEKVVEEKERGKKNDKGRKKGSSRSWELGRRKESGIRGRGDRQWEVRRGKKRERTEVKHFSCRVLYIALHLHISHPVISDWWLLI